jgi:glycosyltransferase involved in cell wall biosynthesis
MLTEPIIGDLSNPLISILIFDYEKKYLNQCLDYIFQQNILKNYEIILLDNATQDGSWEIAVEYAAKYPQLMTISRNRTSFDIKYNRIHCMRMAKGMYCALLAKDLAFLPEYIHRCVQALKSDPHVMFDTVWRKPRLRIMPPTMNDMPLVSILCYNYNYGRYLRQCLESAFAQTYENIEVCFSDNASTDESWEITLEFAKKYPDKMRLARNRKNFGPDDNFANCRQMMSGKYYINFCSDDVLAPDYIKRCVEVMESNPGVGMTVVNRSIIDEHGSVTEESPFYNQSCIIPGHEQAAVYMMAGINPSVAQVMYLGEITGSRSATAVLGARYYGTRILDFNISLDYDVAFIKEPLLFHRIHSQSDTSQADSNLMPIVGLHVLNHQLADIASSRNITKVTERLPQSINKLAGLAVRYSVRMLVAGNEHAAQRYFYLAAAMNPEIVNDTTWQKLEGYWGADSLKKQTILTEMKNEGNLAARTISYDPPPGSIPI